MTDIYHIHAGAHRTGTSSFQLCLHVNKGGLHEAGYDVAYPGRDGVPSGRLSLQLPGPRHGRGKQAQFAERVRRNLAEHARGPGREMILSEENIPGRMLHFFGGQFYPAAEARAEALAAGLGLRGGAQVGTLLFVVRDYAGLFGSAWRKRAEDKAQPPFREQVGNLMAMDRGWPEILATLQAELRPRRLLVVDYAARGKSSDLLWRMVSGVTGLAEPTRRLNISVTEAAIEALQSHFRAGESLDDAARQAIIAAHAEDKAPRGLIRFSEAEQAELKARYLADLDRLRAMPDVQLFA